MRVEIVEHQVNTARRGIDLFEQVLNKGNEVRLGTMLGNLHGPSSALGFDCHEQVACATANVLVIKSHGRPGPGRQGRAQILEHSRPGR